MKADTLVRVLALLVSLSSTTTTVVALRGGSWWRLRDNTSTEKFDDAPPEEEEMDDASALSFAISHLDSGVDPSDIHPDAPEHYKQLSRTQSLITTGLRQLTYTTSTRAPRECEITHAWHPTYSAGWTKGYCSFSKQCNSPRYGEQLDCCQGAYPSQISGHCILQLPLSERPPVPDTYYPKYEEKWEIGYCTNDRPVPHGENGRPQYATMLDCCDGAYGAQLSGACYDKLPPGERPTQSPTTLAGQSIVDYYYPHYEVEWSKSGCTNAKPKEVNGYTLHKNDRPSYGSHRECCDGAYAGQVSGACYDGLPPGERPTQSPTTLIGKSIVDHYYPIYEVEWSKSGCTNAKPKEVNGYTLQKNDRPFYDSHRECCDGAYAGQVSGACYDGLPEGERPTAAPTGIGGPEGWYGGTHKCYGQTWPTATCQNKKLNDGDCGFYQAGDSYDTKLECCDASYGGQFSNTCYAWATKCASGTDVCADSLASPPTTFDASVGCDSCDGDYACLGATGSIGITGPYCRNRGSCVGTNACVDFGWDITVTPAVKVAGSSVGGDSCLGENSCAAASGKIADESCTGYGACQGQIGTIGTKSCLGKTSCSGASGKIADESCTGEDACLSQTGTIGAKSCTGNNACLLQAGTIGTRSCIGEFSCTGNIGTIGELSCTKGNINGAPGDPGHKPPSCASNRGTIGHGSCTEHASCITLGFGKSIGNGSCKKENACTSLEAQTNPNGAAFEINVGDNSCNRAAGCSSCTVDVPNNQCNDGNNPATGVAYDCPASCG